MPKFVIRQPHFIEGVGLIDATPDSPKVVEVDEKWIPKDPARRSPHLEPYVEEPKPAQLGKHFNAQPHVHVQSAAQVQSEPKGKRPSDKQAI